jgi:hypothetical protein
MQVVQDNHNFQRISLVKVDMATQIYVNHSNITFYEFSIEWELSCYMQTDFDDANKHFCNLLL